MICFRSLMSIHMGAKGTSCECFIKDLSLITYDIGIIGVKVKAIFNEVTLKCWNLLAIVHCLYTYVHLHTYPPIRCLPDRIYPVTG